MDKFDAACFQNNYGCDFLNHVAEKFGKNWNSVCAHLEEEMNMRVCVWIDELCQIKIFVQV